MEVGQKGTSKTVIENNEVTNYQGAQLGSVRDCGAIQSIMFKT